MVCGIHLPEQQDFQSTYKLTAMSAKILAMFVFLYDMIYIYDICGMICDMIRYGMIYLSAIELTTGDSTHLHTYNI
jgi:hypothetical protein